jgi:hypothetical protein
MDFSGDKRTGRTGNLSRVLFDPQKIHSSIVVRKTYIPAYRDQTKKWKGVPLFVKWFAQVQYSSNQQGRQLVPKEFRYQISNKFGYRATKERGA